MNQPNPSKIHDAIKVLREHNIWRRGGDEQSEGTFHEPSTIGRAIDTLCAFAERHTRAKSKAVRKPTTWRDTRANCS
jgi:hypothetical protein